MSADSGTTHWHGCGDTGEAKHDGCPRTLCTWEGCSEKWTHECVGKDGRVWARLCQPHSEQLTATYAGPVRGTLSAWVKAQGGAKAAARRM